MSFDSPRPSLRRLGKVVPMVLVCSLGYSAVASAAPAPAPQIGVVRVDEAAQVKVVTTAAPTGLGPFDTAAELVTQFYKDVLYRPATEAEVAVAAAAINGGMAPENWIAALIDSPEMEADVRSVVRLYRAYFLRNPDRQGLRHWINKRREGWPLGQISHEFAKSNEFAIRYGQTTDGEFMDLIYDNVMDRTPDAAGRAYWIGRLEAGLYRGTLMTRFSETPEYKTRSAGGTAIIPLYNGMYQTSISRGIYDYLAPSIVSGRNTVAGLARTYLDDPKYQARFN